MRSVGDPTRIRLCCLWTDVGPPLDASLISDEAGAGEHGSFTGAFIGMVAFDTSGAGACADFGFFEYEGVDIEP